MRAYWVAIAVSLAFGGCTATKENNAQMGSTWVGHSVKEFIRKYGMPAATQVVFTDAEVVYSWPDVFSKQTTESRSANIKQAVGNGETITRKMPRKSDLVGCNVRMVVSRQLIIHEFTVTSDGLGAGHVSLCASALRP